MGNISEAVAVKVAADEDPFTSAPETLTGVVVGGRTATKVKLAALPVVPEVTVTSFVSSA